jgi:hypothetical protein
VKCPAKAALAGKFQFPWLLEKAKKPETSESNPMLRRPATRNTARANALLAVTADLVNRVNLASQESLANRAAAIGLPAGWIAATVDRVTSIVEIVAANAAVAVIVEIAVTVANVHVNAPQWIVTVAHAMTAVDAAATGTADLATVIAIATVVDAKIVAGRAITIVLVKATVGLANMIVLLPVGAVIVTTIVLPNAVATVAMSAIAIVITRRAVNRCAIILRVVTPVAAAVAAKSRQQFSRGGLRPAFFISAFPLLASRATGRQSERNLHPTPPMQSPAPDETHA